MALDSYKTKADIVAKFGKSPNDTASPEVQVALITKRLENLAVHFSKHGQDKHSRRGLLGLVSKRKRLLGYLKSEDITRYRSLISELGLRK